MKRMNRSRAAGVLLAALAACGGSDSNGNSHPPPNSITINLVSAPSPAFQPAVDTIAAGGTVTWQWDAGLHDVTSFSVAGSPTFPDVASHSGVQTQQTMLAVAGTYHFFCTNHASQACTAGDMCGVIVAQ
jgi:plastocyanin